MAHPPQRRERELIWVVQAASAISLGTLAALLYSVRTVNPSIQFRFSFATIIAFALAAAASWAFWHVVFQLSTDEGDVKEARRRKRWLALLATFLAGALLAAFVYPLRGFSHERLSEVSVGALIAVGFLTVLGILFWRVVRFLES
jgi:hypothetical protein